LTVKEIEAVVFFKEIEPARTASACGQKATSDVNRVAKKFGGGGHKNAAGCSLSGAYAEVRARLVAELESALGD